MKKNLNKPFILVSIPLIVVFILTAGNLINQTFLEHYGLFIAFPAIAVEGLAVWTFREQDTRS